MSRCWIALGGNQGSVSETFRRAAELLRQTPGITVTQLSQLYTTAPVGADAGGEFLNAAAELQSTLSPFELLARLHEVESQLGRARTVHWGPRTLDLDLLLYADQQVSTPTLTVPHPHLWYRRFVLDPLVEIAPDVVHCGHALTIAQLRERLLLRPLNCALLGGACELRNELRLRLAAEYPQTMWEIAHPAAAWLAFCLNGAPQIEGLPAANRIDVMAFPTVPEQSIRNVLAAALGSVRRL